MEHNLAQSGGLQPTDGLPEPHQLGGRFLLDASLVSHDLLLDVRRREVELDGHHALPRGVLQVLQHALVPRVVGDDEAELWSGIEADPESVDRQQAPMVGQRMENHRRVLARLDDLVEVADQTRHAPLG